MSDTDDPTRRAMEMLERAIGLIQVGLGAIAEGLADHERRICELETAAKMSTPTNRD